MEATERTCQKEKNPTGHCVQGGVLPRMLFVMFCLTLGTRENNHCGQAEPLSLWLATVL